MTVATSPRRAIMMRGPAGLHSVKTSIGIQDMDDYPDPEREETGSPST